MAIFCTMDPTGYLWWIMAASAVMFLASLILVPLILVRLPANYFSPRHPRHRLLNDSHGVLWIIIRATRNILGIIFLLAGIIMIVTPGQGLLTIFIGIMLVDFPGKFRFERWIISRPRIFRTVNRLRHRAGRDPLSLD